MDCSKFATSVSNNFRYEGSQSAITTLSEKEPSKRVTHLLFVGRADVIRNRLLVVRLPLDLTRLLEVHPRQVELLLRFQDFVIKVDLALQAQNTSVSPIACTRN